LDKLECLSLLNNPITTKKYYRHYIIHKIPQVKLLDFRRIRMKERQEAEKLFKGAKGKLLEKEIGIKSKAMGGGVEDEMVEKERERLGGGKRVLAPADVDAIKAAISKAQTLEEIERLNQLLKSGYIPGKNDSIGETKEMDVSMEENIEENRNGRGE
jgi:U2 small nuclear ribonucleoprotein A'